MFIKINGSESEVAENLSIQGLLLAHKLGESIIIELNGAIIARRLWESTILNLDDQLEITRIMAGG